MFITRKVNEKYPSSQTEINSMPHEISNDGFPLLFDIDTSSGKQ